MILPTYKRLAEVDSPVSEMTKQASRGIRYGTMDRHCHENRRFSFAYVVLATTRGVPAKQESRADASQASLYLTVPLQASADGL